jgi:hypothetical protein
VLTHVSERAPDAQTAFTPSLDTADFTFRAEPPIQNVLVNGVDLARVVMLDAFTFNCRRSIRVIDKDVIRHHQDQGYRSSSGVCDSDLVLQSARESIQLICLEAYTNARDVRVGR